MLTEEKDVDRRVRRTKQMFRNALIKLLEQKDYKHITVTDIVEYADYNRATFYLHYKYKDDLAEEVVEGILNEFIVAFRFPYQQRNHLVLSKLSPADIILFDYILENRDFFTLWKKSEWIPQFQERFIQTLKMLIKETFVPSTNLEPENNKNLFVTFQAYGIMGLITEWIQSDFESSPSYMAAQLIDIISFYPLEIPSSVL
jgi:AcrR family transcriptional regulator